MSTYTSLTLYTDGASRGNPGPAAGGVHIVDEMTKETVVDFGVPLCKRQEQSEPHAIGKTEPPPFQYIVKTVPPASVSSVESESSRPP